MTTGKTTALTFGKKLILFSLIGLFTASFAPSTSLAGPPSRTIAVPGLGNVEIEDIPLTRAQLTDIKSRLTSDDFNKFDARRVQFLTFAAKTLSHFRWVVGSTAVLGSNLLSLFRRDEVISVIHPSEKLISEVESSQLPLNSQVLRFATTGVQKTLEAINKELWIHAPVVVNGNEYGASILISPNGGVVVGTKGRYYAASLGLAVSFNTQIKQMRLEFFADFENKAVGLPVQANIALIVKPSLFISAREKNVKPYKNAMSRYPLGMLAVEDSESHLAISWPWNLGLITTPFDSFIAQQSHLHRKVLGNLNISLTSDRTRGDVVSLREEISCRSLFN